MLDFPRYVALSMVRNYARVRSSLLVCMGVEGGSDIVCVESLKSL